MAKIQKNLSGPERWARVDQITNTTKAKKSKPGKFKNHDFGKWTLAQKEAYVTTVTGIKPNKGSNKDLKAGRSKGRYIKGNI